MHAITPKLLSWASILEFQAMEQARKTSAMPFIYPHVALMPDAHHGKGSTVGSVVPTVGAIMPACVGVDIGCGMMAVRTQFTREDMAQPDLRRLHADISAAIPLSAGNYNQEVSSAPALRRVRELEEMPGADSAEQIAPNWRLQLGSLGSGNHFLEVSADERQHVWLLLHSGSRGVGNKLAAKHIKIAQQECLGTKLPDPDLAYLSEGTPEFSAYIRDLRWAQHFALLNRDEMMNRMMTCLERQLEPVQVLESVRCHHNYTEHMPAQLMVCFLPGDMPDTDRDSHVWLTRKGAIDASAGCPGIIPGSMGDASFIVTGKGNPDSLWSAPHGAGRMMSRSAAKKTVSREELDLAMKGVVWGESDAFLDEAPAAYKPVQTVMEDAADLVQVEHELHQLVNVKGN
jgi:tRNA-splicing ligase RtcB (3'-phosphate/5'-hydroxy nucleic acid ligase)